MITVLTVPVDKTEDANLYTTTTGASVSQASLDPTVRSMWMNAECIAILAVTEENVSTLLDHISKSMMLLKVLIITIKISSLHSYFNQICNEF